MKTIWRIRFAVILWWRTNTPLRVGWQCSREAHEVSLEDGSTPSESVAIELSYWEE